MKLELIINKFGIIRTFKYSSDMFLDSGCIAFRKGGGKNNSIIKFFVHDNKADVSTQQKSNDLLSHWNLENSKQISGPLYLYVKREDKAEASAMNYESHSSLQ